ncbi:MAG: alanyl-tRNA editing protein [Candidatus Zixiibacteriota bacterium]|nr:MAG: alanyl-tRNA editing protein [candidate division Zixibacteria bacterium]
MTEKLYSDDSYLLEFESTVEKVQKIEGGYEIILRSSAFYPESGGQPCDMGLLDGQQVISVHENETDEVVHRLEEWNAPVGDAVKGLVDRERRLDNMRKHTGQHILSGAFVRSAGVETVSAHLGEFESTIELSVADLDERALIDAEDMANEAVMKNLPVTISYYDRNQLDALAIRKIPDLEGKYRIIQIGDFDCTACGGTHCHRTGEVGTIKITGKEKLRGHLRVTFLTGRQALMDYRGKHDITAAVSARLTCHFSDLDKSIDKLMDQNAALRKEIGALNKKLLPYEVEQLGRAAESIGGIKIIFGNHNDKHPKDVKELAAAAAEAFKSICLFTAGDRLLISASKGVTPDASRLAALFMGKFGGKGGGSAVFAQVGGLPSEKTGEMLDSFVEIVRSELGG